MALSPQANKMLNPEQEFNQLTVVHFVEMRANSQAHYLVRCICGNEFEVRGSSLTSNNTRSCGCLIKDMLTTHGLSKSRTYKKWLGARTRILKPVAGQGHYYDGLTFCERWLVFANFLADMGECPLGLTIERRDNSKRLFT